MLFDNKALKKLIIPLVVEQLLVITVGFADTVMVASVGEAAVSAVSLVDAINILLINIFAALGTGGAVVAAQFIGQGSKDKAKYSAKQLILITALLSVIIMVIVIAFKIILITFMTALLIIDILELPIALNNAAPELYNAIKGYDIAENKK